MIGFLVFAIVVCLTIIVFLSAVFMREIEMLREIIDEHICEQQDFNRTISANVHRAFIEISHKPSDEKIEQVVKQSMWNISN